MKLAIVGSNIMATRGEKALLELVVVREAIFLSPAIRLVLRNTSSRLRAAIKPNTRPWITYTKAVYSGNVWALDLLIAHDIVYEPNSREYSCIYLSYCEWICSFGVWYLCSVPLRVSTTEYFKTIQRWFKAYLVKFPSIRMLYNGDSMSFTLRVEMHHFTLHDRDDILKSVLAKVEQSVAKRARKQ